MARFFPRVCQVETWPDDGGGRVTRQIWPLGRSGVEETEKFPRVSWRADGEET